MGCLCYTAHMGYYVVEAYSGRDAEAEAAVQSLGYVTYRPCVVTKVPHHRYPGVLVTKETPLMPGYFFVEKWPAYLGPMSLVSVYKADYVLSILGVDADQPIELTDEPIEALREITEWLSSGKTLEQFWSVKDGVELHEAPATLTRGDVVALKLQDMGYKGVILRDRGRGRYVVEVKVAGRLKRVNVRGDKLVAA